jgi:diguanylate cyclase (GGDEF)-like protein
MSLEKTNVCGGLADPPAPASCEKPQPLDGSIELSAVSNVNPFDPDYSDICSQIGEAIGTMGPNWLITGCNAIFARYFGLRQEQIVGRTAFELNPNFDKSIFYPVIKQVMDSGAYSSGLGYSASVSRWLYMKVYPLNGGIVAFVSDATDLDSSHHQMAAVTRRDPLTGLENRLALEAYLPHVIKTGKPFDLFMIDISRFKQINDSLGYGFGDRALMELASRFKSILPVDGSVFRLAGDEFVFVCPQSAEAPDCFVARLLGTVRSPLSIGESNFNLDAAIGWVNFPEDGTYMGELLRRADLSLLKAKGKGYLSGSVRYEDRLEKDIRQKVALETDLRRAIDEGAFWIAYQPKVSTRSGKVVGAEALIRWNHPTLGPVNPGEFLPLAEERGLMKELDSWVIRAVIADAAGLLRHGFQFPIAANITPSTLADPKILAEIDEWLAEHRLPARMLELEITERDLMIDIEGSVRILDRLSERGISVAIDDFGTGYSSFSYLLELDVETIKIDISFVSRLNDLSRPSNKVVKGLISIAHSMGMTVVAEGVEEPLQKSLLKRMGCDVIQGYHVSPPLALPLFRDFLYENAPENLLEPDPYKT